MKESRSEKSIHNVLFALLEQAVYTVFSFICRTVFINTLGKTYLGFNGLFGDILSLLSLAELGFGTAIIYSMYKPMSTGNKKEISALLNLYRKIYHAVGIVVAAIGLAITPFLGFFISDIPDIPELNAIYWLFLLNTTISYFFIYKKSVLVVDQKNYVFSIIFMIITVIQNLLQIFVLYSTRNYLAYLFIQVCCTLANNYTVSIYVNKHYPFLKEYKLEQVDKQQSKIILKNVKAMFLSRVSSAIVSTTDNILISKFVSTIQLGLYSNYLLFTTLLRTIITKVFEGITGSVGNMIAEDNCEKAYQLFKKIWFVNYWIVASCTSSLFVLVNPFIRLWIGEDYLLSPVIVLLICINFFMRFIRNTFITFVETYGLFVEFQCKCAAEAVINLVVSLVLVRYLNMGIAGVLLGTFISNITTNFWFEPYVLFTRKFKVSLSNYYSTFAKYTVILLIATALTYLLCQTLLEINGWLSFAIQMITSAVIINGTLFIAFRKTEEYGFFIEVCLNYLTKLKQRFVRKGF